MSKISISILLVVFSLSSYSQNIFTEDNFPDPVFREIVSTAMSGKTEFTAEEAEQFDTNLHVSGNVFSMKGIEFFTNLTYLNVWDCYVNEFDFSNNKRLTFLRIIDMNSIFDSIDVSQLTNLETLWIEGCGLKNIDLSNNLALKSLQLSNNQLDGVIINLPALESFDCDSNNLTNLVIESAANLMGISCSKNYLSEIDLDSFTLLENIDVSSNRLSDVSFQNNSLLQKINCSNNLISSIHLGNLKDLSILNVSNNFLSEIDIKNCTNVIELNLSKNKLSELNLSGLGRITNIDCSDNELESLILPLSQFLQNLTITNNEITSLDLSNKIGLVELYAGNNLLSELNLNKSPNLERLYCQNNRLESLYFNSTKIRYLNGSNNLLALVPEFDLLFSLMPDQFNSVGISLDYNNIDCDSWDKLKALVEKPYINVSFSPQNEGFLVGCEVLDPIENPSLELLDERFELTFEYQFPYSDMTVQGLSMIFCDDSELLFYTDNREPIKWKNSDGIIDIVKPINTEDRRKGDYLLGLFPYNSNTIKIITRSQITGGSEADKTYRIYSLSGPFNVSEINAFSLH